MYSTCLFCTSNLGSNDAVEHFPVGRRLAFDAARGRLWVVCLACRRWNLSPLEERHEAIEECERQFRSTFVRVSTDNIGLARLREGMELVRIGEPLRPEFAAWRYAGQFSSRRLRSNLIAGATVGGAALASAALGVALGPAALAAGAASVVAVPGITTIMAALPIFGISVAREYLQFERIVARFSDRDGRPVTVRAKHVGGIELGLFPDGQATLNVHHDAGWTQMNGTRALHATSVILANTNREGGDVRVVNSAVEEIERAGTAQGFLEEASNRNGWRGIRTVSVLNRYRRLGAMKLSQVERLALEMSIHEETERRVIEGELTVLAEAWREAEEIAAICDGVLTPPQLEDWLRSRH